MDLKNSAVELINIMIVSFSFFLKHVLILNFYFSIIFESPSISLPIMNTCFPFPILNSCFPFPIVLWRSTFLNICVSWPACRWIPLYFSTIHTIWKLYLLYHTPYIFQYNSERGYLMFMLYLHIYVDICIYPTHPSSDSYNTKVLPLAFKTVIQYSIFVYRIKNLCYHLSYLNTCLLSFDMRLIS